MARDTVRALVLRIAASACDTLPAMTEWGPVAWPPALIRTERLALHESEARDRAAFIELFASPDLVLPVGSVVVRPYPLSSPAVNT